MSKSKKSKKNNVTKRDRLIQLRPELEPVRHVIDILEGWSPALEEALSQIHGEGGAKLGEYCLVMADIRDAAGRALAREFGWRSDFPTVAQTYIVGVHVQEAVEFFGREVASAAAGYGRMMTSMESPTWVPVLIFSRGVGIIVWHSSSGRARLAPRIETILAVPSPREAST